MTTECSQESFAFHALGRPEVPARFDGGRITSDAAGLLLREAEGVAGLIPARACPCLPPRGAGAAPADRRRFAARFTDRRDPDLIEHTVEEPVAQRLYGLALGYEDLNDHDDLRHDPVPAVPVGKNDPLGRDRMHEQDKGKALAGKSTLNRLELTPVRAEARCDTIRVKLLKIGARIRVTVARVWVSLAESIPINAFCSRRTITSFVFARSYVFSVMHWLRRGDSNLPP